jgi:ribonucleoside-diphosphate reductase beta chain
MYGFAAFFIGEQRVATELGPIMRACPDEGMQIFLCTQIADEARHAAFFHRYVDECGIYRSDSMGDHIDEASAYLNPDFGKLFDDMLGSRVDRLASEPEDLETLIEAITLYHIVIEGMLALTGQHYTIVFNQWAGTLPGLIEGFNNIARDEHRHVAAGVRFLRDLVANEPSRQEAVQRVLMEAALPAAGVMKPPWYDEPGGEERFERTFGYAVAEAQGFAVNALQRRLSVIGVPLPG